MAATAHFDNIQKIVHIQARLVFYGSEATPEVARAVMEEINRMYNEPKAKVKVGEETYQVYFVIEYALLTIEETIRLIARNDDYLNNFIRLEKENIVTRSFMGFGLGDNVGHWIVSDQLGQSTTAAHEFGHGMGLDHPARLDYRGSGSPPPIMAPRGTLVDAEYQWDPAAKAGEVGGTMRPTHRRVTVEEIQQIVENITIRPNKSGYLGKLSNITFDEVGRPDSVLA
ncbi:hypothetical protein [Persicitalea sp.]|uniref:hypothetical protein n=1 Tax=Persicitalea sp. TaxID=3100273 RepID=UPI003594124A